MKCPSCSTIQRTVMAIVNASPIVLLLLIFIWSYWAYNVSLSYGLISEGHVIQGSLYILFYHPIFVMCMWSYWTVCRTSPGYTLDVNKVTNIAVLNIEEEEEEDLHQHSPLPITVKRDGAKRYCQKCKIEKFDRTHHCRQCNRCVLKMDQTTIEFYEKSNYRLGNNNTRVDVMRSKYFNPWDLGTRKNIEQVLGKDLFKMLIPVGKT
ncbi:hypothetical protein EDC94DRAFT_530803 [Helicostylum pulchrum]|nr:hypothetical protein EDC94DRAFT_530803 [Helicostylum pulchrum]